MQKKIITHWAPGKVIFAGEWAVLEPGNPALVAALDRGVCASVVSSNAITFSAPDMGLYTVQGTLVDGFFVLHKMLSDGGVKKARFVVHALSITLRYLYECHHRVKSFDLRVASDISKVTAPNGKKTKCGLGSSAATVVAVTSAVLAFHGYDVQSSKDKDLIFKLSSSAHFIAQGAKGSCCDVAASVYGGCIAYERFDPHWLSGQLATRTSVSTIVSCSWPALKITPVQLPKNCQVGVGFVGTSASTTKLLMQMQRAKQHNPVAYHDFCKATHAVIKQLLSACDANDSVGFCNLIRENKMLLSRLSKSLSVPVETKKLEQLVQIAQAYGVAAKLSGAGGGDCGIAVCFDEKDMLKVMGAWGKVGIIPIAHLRF